MSPDLKSSFNDSRNASKTVVNHLSLAQNPNEPQNQVSSAKGKNTVTRDQVMFPLSLTSDWSKQAQNCFIHVHVHMIEDSDSV